uniref:WWE domain-containing protein n=1 Tax=Eutreptiella gymnastica TaxID=73025 RepID=A0A7S4CPH2_9EUGL
MDPSWLMRRYPVPSALNANPMYMPPTTIHVAPSSSSFPQSTFQTQYTPLSSMSPRTSVETAARFPLLPSAKPVPMAYNGVIWQNQSSPSLTSPAVQQGANDAVWQLQRSGKWLDYEPSISGKIEAAYVQHQKLFGFITEDEVWIVDFAKNIARDSKGCEVQVKRHLKSVQPTSEAPAQHTAAKAPSESSTHRAVVAAADTPMALVTEGTCAVVMDKPAGPPAPLAFPSCGPPAMVSGRRGSCTTLLTDGTDAQIGPTQTGTTPTCLDVPNSLPTTTFRVPQPLPTDLPTPMPTTSNALTRPLHPTADDKPAASDPESSRSKGVVAAADTPMSIVTEGTCAVLVETPTPPPAPTAFPTSGTPAMASGRRGSTTHLVTDGTDALLGPTPTTMATPVTLEVPSTLPTTTFHVPQPLPTDLPTPVPMAVDLAKPTLAPSPAADPTRAPGAGPTLEPPPTAQRTPTTLPSPTRHEPSYYMPGPTTLPSPRLPASAPMHAVLSNSCTFQQPFHKATPTTLPMPDLSALATTATLPFPMPPPPNFMPTPTTLPLP